MLVMVYVLVCKDWYFIVRGTNCGYFSGIYELIESGKNPKPISKHVSILSSGSGTTIKISISSNYILNVLLDLIILTMANIKETLEKNKIVLNSNTDT